MAEIVAFISGCVFTLILVTGCIFVAYNLISYKESTETRKEAKKKALERKNAPAPSGGVIRQKTQEEIDLEKNDEARALAETLGLPLGRE